jgi:hypothetical protein
MIPKEVSLELRKAQRLFKETNDPISNMAKDAADAIDSLQVFVDLINGLPTCNECHNKACKCKPPLGKTVVYNCPMFIKKPEACQFKYICGSGYCDICECKECTLPCNWNDLKRCELNLIEGKKLIGQ